MPNRVSESHEHAMQIILEKVISFFLEQWSNQICNFWNNVAHNVLLHSKSMDIKPNKALFSETKHKLSESELFVIYSMFAYFTNVH